MPAVAKALGDEDMNVRYAACYALGKIGRDAMPAKQALQKDLSAADPFLRTAAVWPSGPQRHLAPRQYTRGFLAAP